MRCVSFREEGKKMEGRKEGGSDGGRRAQEWQVRSQTDQVGR
jgi:hypothetical protein